MNKLTRRKLLITGITGFIGSNLLHELQKEDEYDIACIARKQVSDITTFLLDLNGASDYSEALVGVDTVVHLGGMSAVPKGQDKEAFEVNTRATLQLANQASQAGVRRFIFVSTAKVLGDISDADYGFMESSSPNPSDTYAQSKADAEAGLLKISADSEMDAFIIRPPLVYGPGGKGSIQMLLKVASKPLPLPLSKALAPKSVIFVGNLVDLIKCMIDRDKLSAGVYHCQDDRTTSVSDLILIVRKLKQQPKLLIPVPVPFLSLPLRILGKNRIMNQLFSACVIDDRLSRQRLNWCPRYSLEDAVQITLENL